MHLLFHLRLFNYLTAHSLHWTNFEKKKNELNTLKVLKLPVVNFKYLIQGHTYWTRNIKNKHHEILEGNFPYFINRPVY